MEEGVNESEAVEARTEDGFASEENVGSEEGLRGGEEEDEFAYDYCQAFSSGY